MSRRLEETPRLLDLQQLAKTRWMRPLAAVCQKPIDYVLCLDELSQLYQGLIMVDLRRSCRKVPQALL